MFPNVPFGNASLLEYEAVTIVEDQISTHGAHGDCALYYYHDGTYANGMLNYID